MSKIFTWLRGFAAALGACWLIVTCTPLLTWWTHQLAQPWGTCQGDVLVVLAGNGLGDGVLGSSSYWRSVYTVRAMRQCSYRQVIISGGKPDGGGAPTAELMAGFVRAHGLDSNRIQLESASSSTLQNAQNSLPLLDPAHGKVILLTSDYHIWRAVRVFRKAGVAVETCPVPDAAKRAGAWENRAAIFVELATETAKIAWYRWHAWI